MGRNSEWPLRVREAEFPSVSGVRQALRLVGVAACVVWYFLAQGVRCVVLSGSAGVRVASTINRWSGRFFLRVLGIRVRVRGELCTGPRMVVSNHWSWLDPIALDSLSGLLYITSSKVRAHPFLGKVAYLAGCLFVSRSPWNLPAEIALARRTACQAPLAFFPEATSGDGSGILPFRNAFFEVAAQGGLQVQPVLLRWSDARAAWYGEMDFWPHLRTVLKLRDLVLEVRALEPLPAEEGYGRKELCARAEKALREAFEIES